MKLVVAGACSLAALVLATGALARGDAKAPAPKIKTGAGVFTIDGTLLADRYPARCEETDPFCQVADPGYRVLIVWLKAERGAKLAKLSNPAVTKGVYIKSSSGARSKVWSAGFVSLRPLVVFTPRANQSKFTLHWPGNKPIVLPKPVRQIGPG